MKLRGDSLKDKLLLNSHREGDCLRWDGAHISTGYGHISTDGKSRAVHRVAYETFIGPIPDGLEIDHLCGVRDCIEPTHLDPVTHRENLLRSNNFIGVQARSTTCKRGHEKVPSRWASCKECRERKVQCETCGIELTAQHLSRHNRNFHAGVAR